MSATDIDQIIHRIRNGELPPVQWDSFTAMLTPNQIERLADQLSSEAQALTRAAVYFETRRISRHAGAVKAQNKAATVVRKVLGYTYPRDVLTF